MACENEQLREENKKLQAELDEVKKSLELKMCKTVSTVTSNVLTKPAENDVFDDFLPKAFGA